MAASCSPHCYPSISELFYRVKAIAICNMVSNDIHRQKFQTWIFVDAKHKAHEIAPARQWRKVLWEIEFHQFQCVDSPLDRTLRRRPPIQLERSCNLICWRTFGRFCRLGRRKLVKKHHASRLCPVGLPGRALWVRSGSTRGSPVQKLHYPKLGAETRRNPVSV